MPFVIKFSVNECVNSASGEEKNMNIQLTEPSSEWNDVDLESEHFMSCDIATHI